MTTQLPVEIVGAFMQAAPVDIIALAHALGLEIRQEALPDTISGKIECSRGKRCRITVNALHGLRRQRFTIAHEIAHYVLHRDLIGDGIEDNALYRSTQPGPIERQANLYAADILMPWRLVKEVFATGKARTADELADLFKVSPAVAAIRMEELGLNRAGA